MDTETTTRGPAIVEYPQYYDPAHTLLLYPFASGFPGWSGDEPICSKESNTSPRSYDDDYDSVQLSDDIIIPADYYGATCECDMLSLCSTCFRASPSPFAFDPSFQEHLDIVEPPPPQAQLPVVVVPPVVAELEPPIVNNVVLPQFAHTRQYQMASEYHESQETVHYLENPVVVVSKKKTTTTKQKKKRKRKKSSASPKPRGRAARKKGGVITAETCPRDEQGKPLLPVKIGANFKLLSLGVLVPGESSRWRVHSIPMPVGYASERQFHSIADPTQKVWWRSEVIKGEDGYPRFRVTDPLAPDEPFVDISMGRVWTDVAKKVRTLQERSTKSVLSGPKCFGFDRPIVRDLINEMVGVSSEHGRNKRRTRSE